MLSKNAEQEYHSWKKTFIKSVKDKAKTYSKYPGHGAAGMMDMHDMFTQSNMNTFI